MKKNRIKTFIYTIISYLSFSSGLFALPAPNLSSQGAVLIEPNTNTILYAKNANQKFYPASTTKVLTCLILIEEMPPYHLLTKSAESIKNVPSDSSHIGLVQGDEYDYLSGLYAILMGSDNFVSYDMATYNAGNIAEFANKMNEKAISLGATSSNFVNPHGYHNIDHYTTPYDLAQISIAAFSNPTLEKIAGTPNYTFDVLNKETSIPLKHTAALLDSKSSYFNPNVTAVKTGYHTPAGRTLVAKAVYDNIELVGVVMNTESPLQFQDMNALFEYGQANFDTLSFGEDIYIVDNHSYSPWAKEYVDYALNNSLIPRSMRNYQSTLSINEFINLLQKVLTPEEAPFLYNYVNSTDLSMTSANLPLARQDAAYIIYNICNEPYLKPYRYYDLVDIPDIKELPYYYQEAIHYTTSTKLLGNPTTAFNPTGNLTYEQALSIAYKLDKMFSSIIPYSFTN